MLYILPTKRGMGVEVWGTDEDLTNLYEVVGKFWNDESKLNIKGFENRDKVISGFSYEIRKAKEKRRLKSKSSHFSIEKNEYYGFQITWVHVLFTLSALKYNMRFCEINKFEISQILLIEFWLEKAMMDFDEVGARNLIGYIEDGLYGANPYIYQYMRSINLEYHLLGGGKKAFRKLPELLRRGIYFSDEYKAYEKSLQNDAALLKWDISKLELDDDHIDYENIRW